MYTIIYAHPVAVVELAAVRQEGLGPAPLALDDLHQLVPRVGPRDAASRHLQAGPQARSKGLHCDILDILVSNGCYTIWH